jgi:hypothetical protein
LLKRLIVEKKNPVKICFRVFDWAELEFPIGIPLAEPQTL